MTNIPTPIARLSERHSRLLPGDFRSRFDESLVHIEGVIKWVVVICASCLSRYEQKVTHMVEYDLVRADGIGDWVKSLDRLTQRLHRQPSRSAKALAKNLTQRLNRGDEECAQLWIVAERLYSVIGELDAEDFEAPKSKVSLLQLFRDFVFVRNRTRGHGAKRLDFYEKTASALQEVADKLFVARDWPMDLAVFLGQESPTESRLLILAGLSPERQVVTKLLGAGDRNSLYVIFDDFEEPVPCSPLAAYSESRDLFFVANGAWRETTVKGEFLDYRTGETMSQHLPQFGGTRPSLPPSHTAASELQLGEGAFHDLPPKPQDYVTRSKLEAELDRLLKDKVHRIILLKGPGGIGKTSLSLKVLHAIVQDQNSKFDLVAWLSGRDVDLLLEGPAARERDITDVRSIAESFVRTFGLGEASADPLDIFVECSAGNSSHGTTLLVVDNFETLDDPEGVHQFLDEHVILPCKVLLTSRHTTYKGAFPVDVTGMERSEAEELLKREARSHNIEPRIGGKVVEKIIKATGASPYAMKLAVAYLAHGKGTLDQSLASSLGREDLLTALFDRSYRLLSSQAKYLYHLMAEIGKPCPEVVLRGLIANKGFDFHRASTELLDLSLVEHGFSKDGEAVLNMPYVTRLHAAREALGHPDELLFRSDASEVRGLLHPSAPEGLVAKFFEQAVSRLAEGELDQEEFDHLLDLCRRCAGSEPERWTDLGRALKGRVDNEVVRSFYKEAVELNAFSSETWREWSLFEQRYGDEVQAVYKGIRAVEVGEEDVAFCSQIAGRLLGLISDKKEEFPPHRRDSLINAIRRQLETYRMRKLLGEQDLGKLGWLYLAEYSPGSDPEKELVRKAMSCAEEGLEMDPNNDHCMNLYRKCRTTLGQD